MNVIDSKGVAKAMINKLDRRDICFMDYKTNEKIAIDYEVNKIIRQHYENKLKEK